MSNAQRDIETAIWLTSKVRMVAERKRRITNTVILVLTFWYSFASLSVHLFSNALKDDHHASVGALFSVVSLSLAVLPSLLKLQSSAEDFRRCYLKLQKLLDIPCEDKNKRYSDILDEYPNHTNYDYQDFLMDSIYFRGGKLMDSQGGNIELTLWMKVFWCIRFIGLRIVLLSLGFSVPVLYFLFRFV